ncbi:hypothetical protein F0562_030892 [Nyssa sinensis]|uniref:Uncharacterized protein n=1 Tax=Nyssa sinensis TaxID=561372 RepID=A0A5J5AZS4_9ASTE|nr:hypothetical protein F0562_030892 [Nyssa sinensis]
MPPSRLPNLTTLSFFSLTKPDPPSSLSQPPYNPFDSTSLKHIPTSRHDHAGVDAQSQPIDPGKIQEHFKDFNDDIFKELCKFGEIESLNSAIELPRSTAKSLTQTTVCSMRSVNQSPLLSAMMNGVISLNTHLTLTYPRRSINTNSFNRVESERTQWVKPHGALSLSLFGDKEDEDDVVDPSVIDAKDSSATHGVFDFDFDGRIAEVEAFLKKTTKMVQVQVEVVDQKFKNEVSGFRWEMSLDHGDRNMNLDEIRAFAREIIEEKVEKHVADGLGKVDYSLASSGAMVMKHSEPYSVRKGSSWFYMTNKNGVHSNVENILRPSFGEPGVLHGSAEEVPKRYGLMMDKGRRRIGGSCDKKELAEALQWEVQRKRGAHAAELLFSNGAEPAGKQINSMDYEREQQLQHSSSRGKRAATTTLRQSGKKRKQWG